MNYIIEFEIAAIMIQILLIVMYNVRHNDVCENDKMFAKLLYLELACSVSNIVTVYTISDINRVDLWFNYLINMIYLMTYNMSSIAVFYYIVKVIGGKKILAFGKRIIYLFVGIVSAVIITTPWTGLIISFKDGIYQHGKGMVILYLMSVSLLILIFCILILHRNEINRLQFSVMMAMNVITISAIILQMFFKRYLFQNFAISLSYCMLYISLQSPDDYMDKFTGCRNRRSFYKIMEDRIDENSKVSLVGFALEDFIHTQTMLGYEETGKLLNVISVFLMKKFGKRNVFHVNEERYIIFIDEQQDMNSENVIAQISTYFEKPIYFEGVKWTFSPQFFEMIDQSLNNDEIKDIFERAFYNIENKRNTGNVYIDNKFIQKIRDEKKLIRQMKAAVKEKKFEVYYQPIFHIKEQRFKSAEALVRFFDDEGKMISPEYFIPIAEKNGMILEIGEIVLEKVCQFLKNQRGADKFEYVEVNLSTVQCVRENLPEMINHYVQKYKIDPKRLNFEITETAKMVGENIMMQNMDILCNEGYAFSLDDFGTGFSTALYLTHLPVDIVKIDKSILWSAMKSERAMHILKNMMLSVKQLNKKVLVEGIETEQMVDLLKKLDCDYLQGFFYSKPVPENVVVDFLNNNKFEKNELV